MKKISILCLVATLFFCECSKSDDPILPGNENVETDEDDSSLQDKEYSFPKDFNSNLMGKVIKIKNDLYVTSTYYNSLTNNITLSSDTLLAPTDVSYPKSSEYYSYLSSNANDKLVIFSNDKIPLVDKQTNTLRVGAKISNLKGKVTYANNKYFLTLTDNPIVSLNSRPSVPNVGNFNMKVASMNLEFYLASPDSWGSGFGANSEDEFKRQHDKIISAMTQINADVFAICEIEQGDYAPNYLADALNKSVNSTTNKYKYIDMGDTEESTYTKVSFIYNSEKVSPYKEPMNYGSTYYLLRHIAQCLILKSNNARVILTMNHYKSKNSKNATGNNVDQNDGQGSYNALRTEEAKDGIEFYKKAVSYYGDEDVLVLGDLNSYSMEDPIKVFIDNGYVNELKKYSPKKWSYVFNGEVGYLDHSLASPSLSLQITGAAPWIINAGEPSYFEYKYTNYCQNDPYRYSDHNPIITGLNLK